MFHAKNESLDIVDNLNKNILCLFGLVAMMSSFSKSFAIGECILILIDSASSIESF